MHRLLMPERGGVGQGACWSGQPKQGLLLRGGDALLIPFSLMWGGIAFFWNATVWFGLGEPGRGAGQPMDWFFRLWGLPFLVVGLFIFAGRFWHDAWLHRNLAMP